MATAGNVKIVVNQDWLDKVPDTIDAQDDLKICQRVIKMLIAGGFVTRNKVEQARELAITLK